MIKIIGSVKLSIDNNSISTVLHKSGSSVPRLAVDWVYWHEKNDEGSV